MSVAVVALCAWIAVAPVASAVIAQGVVVVDGKTRIVQHQDGGVVKAIFIRDGSKVAAGQLLAQLDTTKQDNLVNTIQPELALLIARKARLYSEVGNQVDISFPPQSDGVSLADYPTILNDQRRQFEARRLTGWLRKQELQNDRQQDSAAIAGLQKQLLEVRIRMGLAGQDELAAGYLARAGFGTRRSLREMQATSASLSAEEAGITSRVNELEAHKDHTYLEAQRLDASMQEEDELEIQQISRDEQELLQRLNEAKFSLLRSSIMAPVDGTVMNLSINTIGGVLPPASPLLEIVPSEEALVIEAQVEPVDADGVAVGASIMVRAEGIGSQRMPMVAGTLISVSPDRVVDKARGGGYFLVRASVDRAKLFVARGIDLKPGVPVEMMITKKPRSVISYLIGPLLSTFTHALRE